MDASLVRLDLTGNQIGRVGALKLRDMRYSNSTLKWLGVADNPGPPSAAFCCLLLLHAIDARLV